MMLLLESTVQISLLIVVALTLSGLLRNRPAALRHWVLAAALVCAAATPLLEPISPKWQLPLGASWGTPSVEQLPTANASGGKRSVAIERRVPALAVESSDEPRRATAATVLMAVWIAGLCVSLSILIVGAARLARTASRAGRITDGAWMEIAREVAHTYGLRRPVLLLQSDDPRLLVTWGVLQPKVILPANARDWPQDRIRLVLYHELAHVGRGDWIIQLLAEVLRSVHWFNPLVWIACTRLRDASEHACDDVVLRRGIEGSEYAKQLVEIARDLRQRRTWMPAPAIARPSSLERRVKAMLDNRVNRRPVSRFARALALVALLGVTVPLAGLATQTTFSTLTGSIVDPTNAALPAVTLVLTNVTTNVKHELQTDHTGRYEFVGLPPGEYQLETRLPGFASFQGRLTIAGQNVQQDLTLEVGSIQETITVVGGPGQMNASSKPDLAREKLREKLIEGARALRAAARCPEASPGNARTGGSTRIGGNLRAPMKITDVKPRYPDSLQQSAAEGTVVLRGRIDADGRIAELNVVSSTHEEFTNAAIEAVRQWEFDSTLLNCVAIEVPIKVTVNFAYRQ